MTDTQKLAQGTPEWHAARCGKITASRIGDMLAQTKSGWGASRDNYRAEIVAQRLTGVTEDGYSNAYMDRGNEVEPQARAAYAMIHEPVEETGFVIHPYLAYSGASPDGLVGSRGLIQIKCQNLATHIGYLTGKAIPKKYMDQMHWETACTDRDWIDFVSFHPDMPPRLQLFVKRIARDEERIREIEKEVMAFNVEIEALLTKLKGMG